MNRNQRRMAAYNAKKSAEAMQARNLDKKLTIAITGCSLNVSKAVSSPSLRTKPETAGSACLPQVAIYSAGHRKSNVITAR